MQVARQIGLALIWRNGAVGRVIAVHSKHHYRTGRPESIDYLPTLRLLALAAPRSVGCDGGCRVSNRGWLSGGGQKCE